MPLTHFKLSAKLAERHAQQRFRQCKTHDSPQGATLIHQGQTYLNFSSNDYLGLANHPLIKKAFIQSVEQDGVGSGAAHLVCGHHRQHHALEEDLAAFTGREAALLFSTGYMANVGIINALVGRGDAVFEDRLNHASLLDGGLSSGARFNRYRHNDMQDLQQKLQSCDSLKKLVVTDAVFSMDGDIAPLPKLIDCCQQQQAALMIDDAHGFGVLGNTGAGTSEHLGCMADDVPIYMATLGKAVGTFGAFVAGSHELVEYLRNFARPYIYTTALPPAIAAATRQSLRLMAQDTWRREQLQAHIQVFREQVLAQGWSLMASDTAIQPLLVGDEQRALQLSLALANKSFWVTAIRPPTVPVGESRLRITLTAAHTTADVQALIDALAELRASHV